MADEVSGTELDILDGLSIKDDTKESEIENVTGVDEGAESGETDPISELGSDDSKDNEDEETFDETDEGTDSEDEEVEDPKEDDLKFSAVGNRPSYKEIKDKFPEFFKAFPGAREALFAERDYRKAFPTVADANEAVEQVEVFQFLQSSIESGNSKPLVNALKGGEGDKVLEAFTLDFLPTLQKESPNVFFEAIKPILANVLKAALIDGRRSGNKNLEYGAKHLSMHLFSSIIPPEIKPKEVSQESKALQTERENFFASRHDDFRKVVDTSASKNAFRSATEAVNEVKLPAFAREALAERIFKATDRIVASDIAHQKSVQKLWEQAGRAGFNDEFKSRIVKAYLERFRSIMPGVKRKLIAQALSDKPKGKTSPVTSDKTTDKKLTSVSKGAVKDKSDKSKSRTGDLDAQIAILD